MDPHKPADERSDSAGCSDVPDGAAVFPLIPEELGIHPLLLATLHAIVFFDGSDADVVNDAAANEALNYFATYLQRLQGSDLKRICEDMDALLAFAKQEGWPKEEMTFLQEFLKEFGVGQIQWGQEGKP
jgi:hypothetical protein